MSRRLTIKGGPTGNGIQVFAESEQIRCTTGIDLRIRPGELIKAEIRCDDLVLDMQVDATAKLRLAGTDKFVEVDPVTLAALNEKLLEKL